MRFILNAVMGLGLIAAVPAFAQSSSSTTHNQGSTAPGQTSANTNTSAQGGVAHKLQQDLQQSGFKNVRIMPESFLVRAEDKDGHPVMMIVNPDSVTAITQMSAAGSGSSSQTHGSTGSTSGTSGTSGSTTPK
jgi:hypothetical protein